MITTTSTRSQPFVVPSTPNGMRTGNPNCSQRSVCLGSSSMIRSGPPSLSSSSLLSGIQTTEMDTSMFLLPDNPLLSPLLIATVALVLLISAQSFINKMLEGDQGLGAFLSDGSGFNRSGFRPSNRGDDGGKDKDPLPWLKLPRLDFVEVAGQNELPPPDAAANEMDEEERQRAYEELEGLRLRLNRELENVRKRRAQDGETSTGDDMAEARRLQTKLEGLMKLYGIEYETD
ncbi:unnamed protein product [Pseudo-nitzschia multistriata]|uniref:Uncharacterized protein n=1 Tax=Pseudo-nitzschia multistriata TaxID=183589 RepID=A0A448Z118_9STRA|nr:unnamed protein product [Pseudo-nitzschia multistriata]